MHMKTINNELIRSFSPCYDPSEKKIPNGETLSVLDWVEKYRSVVPPKDIIWLLCRNEFLSDRDLRLFAVWCAREALGLIDSPDPRSVAACDVAERYADGDATNGELRATYHYADAAAYASTKAAYAATRAAAYAADAAAAYAAAEAAYAATRAANAATRAAYEYATYAATRAAAYAANAAYTTAEVVREKQLNQLLTYFEA